jgi:predicted small lipoprotein YifL
MISRLMIAGVLIAALGLGACGKKGPLEPPKAMQSIALTR